MRNSTWCSMHLHAASHKKPASLLNHLVSHTSPIGHMHAVALRHCMRKGCGIWHLLFLGRTKTLCMNHVGDRCFTQTRNADATDADAW